MTSSLIKQENPHPPNLQYLVIDDEIAAQKSFQESFVRKLNFSGAQPQFVSSCEEAIDTLQKDPNILLCFVDCALPKSRVNISDYSLDFEQEIKENGIDLVEQLCTIKKNLLIIIISQILSKAELIKLQQKYVKFTNIIECIHKTEPETIFRQSFAKALSRLNIQHNLKNNEFQSTTSKHQKTLTTSTSFSYDNLDLQTQLFVKEKTEKIKQLFKRSVQDIVDIGGSLYEVKASLDYGQFQPWLKTEFQWSLRTASRFMNVYSKFRYANLAELDFVPSVLYELAASSVPEEAIQEVIQRKNDGEEISLELAKNIKAKHTKPKASQKVKISSNAISQSNTVSPPESKVTPHQNPRQEILQVIPQQNLWSVGKHTVFCGDPNSANFINLLPANVSLCLSFPQQKNWLFQYHQYNSAINIYSKYPDLDLDFLLESISRSIQIATESNDSIVICFIPHQSILSIVNSLGCHAFIAEPNRHKCLALVSQ